jgi:hypothetical protein
MPYIVSLITVLHKIREVKKLQGPDYLMFSFTYFVLQNDIVKSLLL